MRYLLLALSLMLMLAACSKRDPPVARFRGLTPTSYSGNLGGRTGAHALCDKAFPGSHFCSDIGLDQAPAGVPLPGSGAWVDTQALSGADAVLFNCNGWTSTLATFKPDGKNIMGGLVIAPPGVFTGTLAGDDGGCENARPLACCDGPPPK